jgi:hypothetical protein
MRASHVWRGRCIAPAHEGPRNESNNKAHEPTSGRPTRYGSGRLIRVFRDIGHIFSSHCPSHWRFCFLVVLPCPRDLLLCAKHLFGVAMVAKDLWARSNPAPTTAPLAAALRTACAPRPADRFCSSNRKRRPTACKSPPRQGFAIISCARRGAPRPPNEPS